MRRNSYATVQKQKLVTYLRANADRQFTIGELAEAIAAEGEVSPGRSTLYRQIGRLCADGTVRRFEQAGRNSFVYQYAGEGDACGGTAHFHLKCVRCGRLIHLDCLRLADVRGHIQADHGFRIGGAHGILWGECEACLASGPVGEGDAR